MNKERIPIKQMYFNRWFKPSNKDILKKEITTNKIPFMDLSFIWLRKLSKLKNAK